MWGESVLNFKQFRFSRWKNVFIYRIFLYIDSKYLSVSLKNTRHYDVNMIFIAHIGEPEQVDSPEVCEALMHRVEDVEVSGVAS